MEVTSPSESEESQSMRAQGNASEVMEKTSSSDLSCSAPPAPRGRGRGRGRGSAHGRGSARGSQHGHGTSSMNHPKPESHGQASSSSYLPKPKTAIRKPRGRGQKKNKLQWLQPTPNEDDHLEQTSDSEETHRIAEATSKTAEWARDADLAASSEDEFATPVAGDGQSVPKTSGAFDYATWLLARLTPEQRLKLTSAFTWIDLCAGLGTPFVAYEALRRAMSLYSLKPSGECKGLTEMSKEKRAALRRRAVHVDSSPPIFERNSDLTSRMPKDDRNNHQDLPVADLLFLGIVCVDISSCTTTPKSLTDDSGASGQCWLDFLAYLDLLNFDERPISLVLECVDNLGHNRTVQGRVEKGTLLVIEALRERGYVGQWRKVSATQFFLPQRRPRVWALFLKVRGGIGPKAIRERERDLAKAFDLIQSSQTSSHESLKLILDRAPEVHAHRPQKMKGKPGQAWMTTQVPKFLSKHGLSDADVHDGQEEFLKTTAEVLLPRQQSAVWLELCRLRQKGKVPNWKDGVFVSDCGSSVGWLSVTRDMFPCVRPGNSYLVLEHGQPKIANGPLSLAVQGIGTDEANAFELLLEEDNLLRSLAGNAFSANICLVFFVATLLSA